MAPRRGQNWALLGTGLSARVMARPTRILIRTWVPKIAATCQKALSVERACARLKNETPPKRGWRGSLVSDVQANPRVSLQLDDVQENFSLADVLGTVGLTRFAKCDLSGLQAHVLLLAVGVGTLERASLQIPNDAVRG